MKNSLVDAGVFKMCVCRTINLSVSVTAAKRNNFSPHGLIVIKYSGSTSFLQVIFWRVTWPQKRYFLPYLSPRVLRQVVM